MVKKWRVIRSFAGTEVGSYGQGDEVDEIPPGVSPDFFVYIGPPESAMLAQAKPKPQGRGLKPVTNVSGVGKTLAAELERIGITTIVDLAISEPDRLARVKGISEKTAPALIKAAREALK